MATKEDLKENAYKYFLNKAKNDEKVRVAVEEAYKLDLHEFTITCAKHLGLGCPRGWVTCWDGSCAQPPAIKCPPENLQ